MYNSIVFSIFIKLCNCYHNLSLEHFNHPREAPYTLAITPHHSSPPTIARQLLICFLSLHICLLWTFDRNEITYYVVFCNWLLSLSICFQGHPCCIVYQCFISFYCQIVFHCMSMPHFVYLFSKRWTFELFPLFSCCDKAAINIHVQKKKKKNTG